MMKQLTNYTKKISFALACVTGLLLTGCGNGYDRDHLSSQRAFLQKLVVAPELLSEKAELKEEWIVTHNGCGKADVGGLLKNLDKGNPSMEVMTAEVVEESTPVESEEVAEGAADTTEEITEITVAKETISEESLDDSRMTALIQKVRPAGSLEGYAEVSYLIKNHQVDESAMIELRYNLIDYPVYYLKSSEVAASVAITEEPANDEIAATVEEGELEASEPVESEAVAEEKPEEIIEDFLPIEPILVEGTEPGIINYQVKAHGLLVELSSSEKNQDITLRCAQEIANRILDEISINQRAINEIRRQKGNSIGGLKTYSPFWEYMGDHIDLEEKLYQPLLKEF